MRWGNETIFKSFFSGTTTNHYFYVKKLVSSNREYFEDEFCEWYEPGAKKKGYSRETAPNQTKLFVSRNHAKPNFTFM